MKPKDEVWIIPLSQEEIKALPFPETASKIGGILVVAEDLSYEDQLKRNLQIEVIRAQFKKAIGSR